MNDKLVIKLSLIICGSLTKEDDINYWNLLPRWHYQGWVQFCLIQFEVKSQIKS